MNHYFPLLLTPSSTDTRKQEEILEAESLTQGPITIIIYVYVYIYNYTILYLYINCLDNYSHSMPIK